MPLSDDPDKRARQIANLAPPVRKGQVLNPNGRRGVSMLEAIRNELKKDAGYIEGELVTNNEYVAKRLVEIAKNAKDSDALQAIKLMLAYFEGQPAVPIKLDIHKAARRIAEETGADPLWLIARAEQIASQMYEEGHTIYGTRVD
jgi:hypothetical protein